MFQTDYADVLGIDWASAPIVPIIGITGDVEGHVVQVRMAITGAGYGWDADIAFCPNIPVPLLGHKGFFEHVEVRFRGPSRRFSIHLK